MKKSSPKSLSLRVRKNSCNFIFYGPNLLVWVTHGKFGLEGWIQKLFIVKPQAIDHAGAHSGYTPKVFWMTSILSILPHEPGIVPY